MVLDARRVCGVTTIADDQDTPGCRGGRLIAAIDKRGRVVIDVGARGRSRSGCRLRPVAGIADLDGGGTIDGGATNTLTLSSCGRRGRLFSRPFSGALLLRRPANTRTGESAVADHRHASAALRRRSLFRMTVFAPIIPAAPQQPITSFNYQNISVNIEASPRTSQR